MNGRLISLLSRDEYSLHLVLVSRNATLIALRDTSTKNGSENIYVNVGHVTWLIIKITTFFVIFHLPSWMSIILEKRQKYEKKTVQMDQRICNIGMFKVT